MLFLHNSKCIYFRTSPELGRHTSQQWIIWNHFGQANINIRLIISRTYQSQSGNFHPKPYSCDVSARSLLFLKLFCSISIHRHKHLAYNIICPNCLQLPRAHPTQTIRNVFTSTFSKVGHDKLRNKPPNQKKKNIGTRSFSLSQPYTMASSFRTLAVIMVNVLIRHC